MPAAEHPVELADAGRLGLGEQGVDVVEQAAARPSGAVASDRLD